MKKRHFIYYVPDYEHEGDLRAAVAELRRICPDADNIDARQERDCEAESDYEHEYGELDEPIYQGIISFDAPEKDTKMLQEFGAY